MWRFAVYTQKTSILSKPFLKTVRQALKHTDGRTDYFRFLSNDAASSIRIEKEQPIREVLSLDDFGLLSVNRSQSIDSMSSAGSEQHTFLEQLFRNDTLNTFSNVQIPTTVSSKELGGSNEVFAHDYVSELLSEGFAADELAEELAEVDSHTYHDDQEPSTSGIEVTALPFLIPSMVSEVEETKTRKMISEKIRRERKLNLSTTTPESSEQLDAPHLFHVPTETGIHNVGEMLFPESIPVESYTSQWKEGETPAPVAEIMSAPQETFNSAAGTEFSLEILEGIMTEGTMAELKKELEAVGTWPEYLFTGDRRLVVRTNAILRFVTEHSETFEDAEAIVSKFVSSHMMAVIPDDVLLHLTIRSCSDASTSESIQKQLETISALAVSRELRPSRQLIEKHLHELYTMTIKKSPKSSASLFTFCQNLGFDRSADIFMKSYGNVESSSENFLKSFDEWKKLSTRYGTQQGIDSFWMAALQKDDAGLAKRIQILLTHSCKSEHPFTTMARMICALNKLNQLDKAFEVFQKVSVSGMHFREPLAEFVKSKDLESIERLATLIERGVIAEKRRGKRVNKTPVEGETQRLFGDKVHEVLAKFYGVGQKKKFVDNKAKRKIHRVDEQQLHELCLALQKAWIQCADSKESVERLTRWCELNRVQIDEKVQKRINFFSK